jgi:hypothetical protein
MSKTAPVTGPLEKRREQEFGFRPLRVGKENDQAALTAAQRDSEFRRTGNRAMLNHFQGRHSQAAKATVCKAESTRLGPRP